MARLRNRIRKADYFSDGELLRWPRDKRATYSGLWAIAEDSGCLEDDPFSWKVLLWPSPLDADITVEVLTGWRDEMVAAGKLVAYDGDGKCYLFIRTFHDHEHPRNPQAPDLPLPSWVSWQAHETDTRKGHYELLGDTLPERQNGSGSVEQPLYKDVTTSPALPCPALPGSYTHTANADDSKSPKGAGLPHLRGTYGTDFTTWWLAYGNKRDKADAERLYYHWRERGATAEWLLKAAKNYHADCERSGSIQKYARTFLAKEPCRWKEWVKPERAPEDSGPAACAGCGAFLKPDEDGRLHCPTGCQDVTS